MLKDIKFTFVVPVSDEEIFKKNIGNSEIYLSGKHEFIIQKNYKSVPMAYNKAVAAARGEILIFVHQDVFFPNEWEEKFINTLIEVNNKDKNWGVLGVAGAFLRKRFFSKRYKRIICGFLRDRGLKWGSPQGLPRRVQTIDELFMVVRKKNAFFDEKIPYNHLYGVDLCLSLAKKGNNSYVIAAYLHHNSIHSFSLSKEFFLCQDYIREKYWDFLPIATTCTRITKI